MCVLGMAITIGKFKHRHGQDFTPPSFLHQEPSGRLNDKWQTGLKKPGLGHTSQNRTRQAHVEWGKHILEIQLVWAAVVLVPRLRCRWGNQERKQDGGWGGGGGTCVGDDHQTLPRLFWWSFAANTTSTRVPFFYSNTVHSVLTGMPMVRGNCSGLDNVTAEEWERWLKQSKICIKCLYQTVGNIIKQAISSCSWKVLYILQDGSGITSSGKPSLTPPRICATSVSRLVYRRQSIQDIDCEREKKRKIFKEGKEKRKGKRLVGSVCNWVLSELSWLLVPASLFPSPSSHLGLLVSFRRPNHLQYPGSIPPEVVKI